MRPFPLLLLTAGLLVASCTDYELNPDGDGSQADDDEAGDPDDDDDNGTDEDDPPDTALGDDGGIRGRVCDPSTTEWVAGAEAYVAIDEDGDGDEDDRIASFTDADGRFTLLGVPEGTWTVVIEKGSFSASYEVEVEAGEITEIAEPVCLEGHDVRIAVVTGEYDDIGAILDDMGLFYDNYEGESNDDYVDLLTDLKALQGYDMLFLNCGVNTSWHDEYATIRDNLDTFLDEGGRLYVSDWSYFFIELAVPEGIDFYGEDTTFGAALDGAPGDLVADVLDPNMQALVGGTTAELNFNLNSWALAEGPGTGATVLVEGDAGLYAAGGTLTDAALAVFLEYGDGAAIFTAFHNEAQATLDMNALLREIVLSL